MGELTSRQIGALTAAKLTNTSKKGEGTKVNAPEPVVLPQKDLIPSAFNKQH
jgi:hypothetical protein